jgi:hypothetical protein
MELALQIPEVTVVDQQGQYQFVVDADLVHVGGGTGLMDY